MSSIWLWKLIIQVLIYKTLKQIMHFAKQFLSELTFFQQQSIDEGRIRCGGGVLAKRNVPKLACFQYSRFKTGYRWCLVCFIVWLKYVYTIKIIHSCSCNGWSHSKTSKLFVEQVVSNCIVYIVLYRNGCIDDLAAMLILINVYLKNNLMLAMSIS